MLGEDRVSVMELVSDKDRKRLAQHRSRWDQRERSTGAGVEEWRSSKVGAMNSCSVLELLTRTFCSGSGRVPRRADEAGTIQGVPEVFEKRWVEFVAYS